MGYRGVQCRGLRPCEEGTSPFPIPLPFQYWALPQILCQALRSRSPAAPSPQATLTLCGDLGRHAGPEQGVAGCRGGEGALAAAAGSRTDCCQG